MADTPNTTPTGAPMPDAQAGQNALQLDQSQLPDSMRQQSFMDQDTSKLGPVQAQPDNSGNQIPPVQQSTTVTTDGNHPEEPTEQTPGKGEVAKQPTPQYNIPPQQHPAVQKASLLNEIATTLAGGPRYQTTVDANTGTVTRTKVPLSTKQLGMAIALEALSGAITGAAQHGPNHVEKAAEAGYQQGQQESQEVQAANQANEDQAKNDYATKAMIAHTNFTTYQSAVTLGKLEYDANHEQDMANAPMIEAVRNQGALLDEGLRGNVADLAKKYHVAENLFIRQNTVPRPDPTTGEQAKDPQTGRLLWDGEYALINPDAKITVPDETLKYLADHHVNGFYRVDEKGKSVPINLPTNTQMRAVVAANAMAAASAIQVGDHAMTGQLSQLGKDADKYVEEFKRNYEDAYNTVDPSALKVFSRYAAVPLDQLQATMIKDKVDPDTRGQIMSLIPTGAIEQSKLDTADKAASQKADAAVKNFVVSSSNYNDVLAAPEKYGAEKVAEAKRMRAASIGDAAAKAGADEAARFSTEVNLKKKFGIPLSATGQGAITTGQVNNPAIFDAIKNTPLDGPVTNGIRNDRLQAIENVDPALAAELQAIGEGRQIQSKYGLAKGDGIKLAELVQSVYPSYNQPRAESYENLQKRFTSGDISDQLRSLNTTFEHAEQTNESAGKLDANVPETADHSAWMIDKAQLIEEINHAYTKGVLQKDKRAELLSGLDAYRPGARQKAVKEAVYLLSDFANEFQNQWGKGKASDAVPKAEIVTEEGRNAFNNLFRGQYTIDQFGHRVDLQKQAQQHTQARQAGVPPGATAARLNGQIVGYRDAQNVYHSLTPPQQ